jgi:hypothetical protein
MLVPPGIRRAHLSAGRADGSILAKLEVPVLVTQGSEDKLVLKGLGGSRRRFMPRDFQCMKVLAIHLLPRMPRVSTAS